jgi:hypothetical protein
LKFRKFLFSKMNTGNSYPKLYKMNPQPKIAILIDGENAESHLIEAILNEVSKYGKITIKRIYGDWTENPMKKWKEKLNLFAIRPMQKFAYSNGKNSTDTALIIDSMDILNSNLVEGFCIVSSDSDYTGLAHRIREQGYFVMGIGKSHTLEAFVKACENFVFSEILSSENLQDSKAGGLSKNLNKQGKNGQSKTNQSSPKISRKPKFDLIDSLKKSGIKNLNYEEIDSAFNMVVDLNSNTALLSRFSEALRKVNPTFDHRNFGFNSFRIFCEALIPQYSILLHRDGQTISLKKEDNPNAEAEKHKE